MLIFLGATAIDTASPTLLSLGLVTIGGEEHHVGLDLADGRDLAPRHAAAVYAPRRGLTPQELAHSTLRWLLQLHEGLCAGAQWDDAPGDRLQLAFGRRADFDLMSRELQTCDPALWRLLRERVQPCDVSWIHGQQGLELHAPPQERQQPGVPDALRAAQALRQAYLVATARGLVPPRRAEVLTTWAPGRATIRNWPRPAAHRPR